MTVTDREQLIRQAINTILNADTGLRTVCGRTTGLAIERLAFAITTELPVAVVDVAGVDFSTNQVVVLVDAVANGPTAGQQSREVCEAVAAALTGHAFNGQSLDIAPTAVSRESVTPDDPLHFGVQREGDPTLHQARVTVPLLYME
jgi:hypothetical protein